MSQPLDFRSFLPPGILLTRDIEFALCAVFQANGNAAPTAPQIAAMFGTLPVAPTTIPYLPMDGGEGCGDDSTPTPAPYVPLPLTIPVPVYVTRSFAPGFSAGFA